MKKREKLGYLARRVVAASFIGFLGLVGCQTYENSRTAEERRLGSYASDSEFDSVENHSAKKPYILTPSYLSEVSTPAGEPQAKSIGEVIYKAYKGKWQRSYSLQQSFSFGHPVRTPSGNLNGSVHAPKGSVWADRFRDQDGTIFITSAAAGRHAYAVKINADGSLKKPYRAYQVGRGNTVRRFYPIYNVPEGSVFKPAGDVPLTGTRVSGWGMSYTGLKNGNLQFKLYEINSRGEEIKSVTFEHDLGKSKELIVRGVRFNIAELKANGVLAYSVVE